MNNFVKKSDNISEKFAIRFDNLVTVISKKCGYRAMIRDAETI